MKVIKTELNARIRRAQRLARWLCSVGCVAGLVVLAGAGLIRTQAQASFPLPAIDPPGAKVSSPPTPSSPASAAEPSPQQPGAAAAQANATGVAQQCTELLRLATDLKSAVDKSSASTLSVTVVRKASEIEQLAHKVRLAGAKN